MNAASVSLAQSEGGGEDGDQKTLREVLRVAASLSAGVLVLYGIRDTHA